MKAKTNPEEKENMPNTSEIIVSMPMRLRRLLMMMCGRTYLKQYKRLLKRQSDTERSVLKLTSSHWQKQNPQSRICLIESGGWADEHKQNKQTMPSALQ